MAHKALNELAAGDIRETYDAAAKRSVRRAAYAMQVLCAVLHWHGVDVPDNPLGRETAGRDRITGTSRRPSADPAGDARRVAASRMHLPSQVAADYYRFQRFGLRATFASIAEELVSSALLKSG